VGRAWSAPLRPGRRGGLCIAFGILAAAALAAVAATPLPAATVQFAPDLRPAILAMRPIPAHDGDIVEITVTVVNVGDTPANTATVELTDTPPNGPALSVGSTILSTPLTPGSSATVRMPRFVASGVGEHTLTIRVTNVTPSEANVLNDTVSVPMEVLSSGVSAPPPPTDGVRIEAIATLGLGALAGFILAIGLVAAAAVLLWRREPYAVQPPPPEPPDRSPPPIWPP
jgi:uncharacterized repeat protein (TIGR01451 family)